MSDEQLKQAYERAMASRAPDARAGCPAAESILALVRREGGEEQRLSVLDHVMACPSCRDDFELLRSVERAGARAAAGETGAGATRGRVVGYIGWQRWAPLAAAALVVLVVTLGPGRDLWRSGDTLRGGVDALALVAPVEGASPSATQVIFIWRSAPGAQRYTLELLTGGGDVALSRTTTDTALAVPLPATLATGVYRWWVTATGADGSETRSTTRALRLRSR